MNGLYCGLRLRTLLGAAVLFSTLMFPDASASADIYVDFGSVAPGLPDTFGAVNRPGVWNAIAKNGLTSLIDTDGNLTAITLTLDSDIPLRGGTSRGPDSTEFLLGGSFSSVTRVGSPSNPNPQSYWSVQFSGLENGRYDIYYYAPAHFMETTGPFSVAGNNVDSLRGADTLIQGTSWDVFRGVRVTDGSIFMESTSTVQFQGLAGLQVVSAVPESDDPALLALAVCGLLCWRRRQSGVSYANSPTTRVLA